MTIDPYAIQNIGIPMLYPSDPSKTSAVAASHTAPLPSPADRLGQAEVDFLQRFIAACRMSGVIDRELPTRLANLETLSARKIELIELQARLTKIEAIATGQASTSANEEIRKELNELRERLNQTIPNYGAF